MLGTARIILLESIEDARREMERLGVDPPGIKIMAPKAIHRLIRLERVPVAAAQIIKEEMLSLGGEAARNKWAVSQRIPTTDMLLMGTLRHYRRLINKLRIQPFGLPLLAKDLARLLQVEEGTPAAGPWEKLGLPLGQRTLVMGILNLTPDSFSGDGLAGLGTSGIAERARSMFEDGADILDVGGESTRPGSDPVAAEEEVGRVAPAVGAIRREVPGIPISVDTYKASVARAALDAGADIVNDISGLTFDAEMAPLVAERGAPVIIMHIKGTPQDMQRDPTYSDVVGEIVSYFRERLEQAREAGIAEEAIALDPGIGFGKTTEHNLTILRRLGELRSAGRPLVVGTSRKSFIGNVLGLPVEDRLEGTAATVALAVAQGADIVRVHDVKEMARIVRMADAIAGTENR